MDDLRPPKGWRAVKVRWRWWATVVAVLPWRWAVTVMWRRPVVRRRPIWWATARGRPTPSQVIKTRPLTVSEQVVELLPGSGEDRLTSLFLVGRKGLFHRCLEDLPSLRRLSLVEGQGPLQLPGGVVGHVAPIRRGPKDRPHAATRGTTSSTSHRHAKRKRGDGEGDDGADSHDAKLCGAHGCSPLRS